ncbi:AAA-like domain protein [Thalassoglobus neptunius]|uniref:AAA-like domain protein n=2 Tax=Thalassoglobus neptunius TaxID=1938619 RepID=A0A5C5WPF0_9PLAN|nr:AAA-like domain protein [Thalassoglobus neptunius]
MLSVLASIHGAIPSSLSISLWLKSDKGEVTFLVDLPDECERSFLQELQDVYPGCTVEPESERDDHTTEQECWNTELRVSPDVLSLLTFDQFVDETDNRSLADPVSGLLSILKSGRAGRVVPAIRLTIQPATRRRVAAAERVLRRFHHRFVVDSLQSTYLRWATHHLALYRVLAAILFRFVARDALPLESSAKTDLKLFQCRLTVFVNVPIGQKQLAERRLIEMAGAFGRFTNATVKIHRFKPAQRERDKRAFLLSPREVATLWHPVTESGDAVSRVERPMFRELEPPVFLTSNKGTVLGRVKFRQQKNQFAIDEDDLRRHMLAIGKTGCGKSTFLLNVVSQQVESNRGIILIDPHGELVDDVLSTVPKNRTNDVIYFDASDDSVVVGFNPMVGPIGADHTLVADGVLTSFKNVFGFDEGSAPRLLHIFRNTLLTLIGTRHASLANVQRLLVDANFRKSAIANVTNKAVREFWLSEFGQWNERDRTQYIASLQNKLGAFTTNERLQRIFDGDRKGIQLREVMDQSKILLCNLSKGQVGHDASTLLGSLLLSSLQIAAMSRADVAEDERPDCTVLVDEFHSYLSDGNTTMADALAESRKYRTSYVLSTQMLEQLDSATLAGVLGNCGSTLCMTVGPRDAEVLAELLGNRLATDDLMNIPKYHGYIRQLVNGAPHTFSMTTLSPPRQNRQRADLIRKVSRQRFGVPDQKQPA